MSNSLTVFYHMLGLMIISTLIHFHASPLSLLELRNPVFAAESETETETASEEEHTENPGETVEEEGAHEEETSANGFSPVGEHSNITQSSNKSVESTDLSVSSLIAQGSPVFGNHSAPVTIVEFGDFQCHFCGRFAKQTEPLLNSTYLQTGKVNLAFKHFVTHGPDSFNAAVATQCAHEQGKFWNFYEVLYNNQGEENSGWVNVENLKRFASGISGLDAQKFDTCLDTQKYKSLVENDTNFAIASGFQGTPTFIIQSSNGANPEVLLGAYPFPSFQTILEKRLSEG
jgi:protein-disulfide isomerase